jgi:acetylornithine deacetylase/succinyl-diaminopimelate desuccinylase-like protein
MPPIARPLAKLFVLLLPVLACPVVAQAASIPRDTMRELAEQAVPRFVDFVQVDTINPPGNEVRAVAFLGAILDAEGIPWESVEPMPGRGSLWAVLEGGDEPPLILLNHTDVVPADESQWDHPPLSGVIDDGYVYGRGALDMKSLGIAQLQAFIALKRAVDAGARLNRDVIFAATADEEAGGRVGAGWLVDNRPEVFARPGSVLLNEGGGNTRYADGTVVVGIETTQKIPLWLRLQVRDRPSHGSTPRAHTAVNRLIRGLARIADTEFEVRVNDVVEAYLTGSADLFPAHLAAGVSDPRTAVQDAEFLMNLRTYSPAQAASLRSTCSVTRLGGSTKINVIPGVAWAEMDCRLLPDEDPEAFTRRIAGIFNDPHVSVIPLLSFTPAVSPMDSELFETLGQVMRSDIEGSRILPTMSTGFTDSHYFRDAGVLSYGFSPFVVGAEEIAPGEGAHGHNERISTENLVQGTRRLMRVLEAFVLE